MTNPVLEAINKRRSVRSYKPDPVPRDVIQTINEAGNQAPVLSSIGSQSVTEGQNLNFGVSATDLDLDSLILTAEDVPANATFTDDFDGTGTFDFNPDYSQS